MNENGPPPGFLKRLSRYSRYRFQTSELRHQIVSFRHRGISAQDVFLASYPKCGSTWLRHMLAYLVTHQSTPWRGGIDKVSVILGRHHRLPKITRGDGRLIKTHEPYRDVCRRAVLLVRDGRDVAISEYFFQANHSSHFYLYKDSFETFFELFLQGRVNGYRAWHVNVGSWLSAMDQPETEVLLVRFEDLKVNTTAVLAQVAEFVGIDATQDQLAAAVEDSSVSSMKKKESEYWNQLGRSNPNFVRSGKSGGWKQYFSPEMEDKFWSVTGDVMNRLGYFRDPVDQQSSPSVSAKPLPAKESQ